MRSEYDYGTIAFLKAKKLNAKQTIQAYIKDQNESFSHNNIKKVNALISSNFSRFATFCDKAIKSGTLKGNAVKLNTYYDEQRERNEQVNKEYKEVSLSTDQECLLGIIKTDYCAAKLHSFITKQGFGIPKMDDSFTARRLRFLPTVNLVIELGIDKFKEHVKIRYPDEQSNK